MTKVVWKTKVLGSNPSAKKYANVVVDLADMAI